MVEFIIFFNLLYFLTKIYGMKGALIAINLFSLISFFMIVVKIKKISKLSVISCFIKPISIILIISIFNSFILKFLSVESYGDIAYIFITTLLFIFFLTICIWIYERKLIKFIFLKLKTKKKEL